jgi:DNA-binding PadR family transcriptional regulator
MRDKKFRHHDEHTHMKFRHGGRVGFGPEAGSGPFGPEGGPGPFGPSFGRGPFGRGGGPGPRGRGRRKRGDVRLALLMLLKLDGPRNGYQLMQGLEEHSEGRWQPSPGSVYPALAQLEDEGLIRGTQVEGESGRTFELTEAGVEQLAERGDARAPWEAESEADDAVAGMRRTLIGTVKAFRQIAQDGEPDQIAKATALLEETRRNLYRLLAGDDQPRTTDQPSDTQS